MVFPPRSTLSAALCTSSDSAAARRAALVFCAARSGRRVSCRIQEGQPEQPGADDLAVLGTHQRAVGLDGKGDLSDEGDDGRVTEAEHEGEQRHGAQRDGDLTEDGDHCC